MGHSILHNLSEFNIITSTLMLKNYKSTSVYGSSVSRTQHSAAFYLKMRSASAPSHHVRGFDGVGEDGGFKSGYYANIKKKETINIC